MTEEIDPDKWYTFVEGAKLIPSIYGHCEHIDVSTLHKWRQKGYFTAHKCAHGSWVMKGEDIIKLRHFEPVPETKEDAEKEAREKRSRGRRRRRL